MFRRLAMAGGACLALAACSNDRPAPTGIQAHDGSTFAASGQVTISGFGHSQTFSASSRGALGKGLSLDRVGPADGKGPVLPVLIVRDNGTRVSSDGGTYRDAQGRWHRLVVISDGAGAPPREFRHYINNTLVRTTTRQWEHRAGAWVQSDLRVREFHGDSLKLDTHVQTTRVRLSSRSLGDRTLALLAAGIARAFGPREAQAQVYSCAKEWQIYIMASGYAAAAASALEYAMMTGNPGIISAAALNYLLATAAMSIAEYNLFVCTSQPSGGGGGGGGGGPRPIAAPTRVTH